MASEKDRRVHFIYVLIYLAVKRPKYYTMQS